MISFFKLVFDRHTVKMILFLLFCFLSSIIIGKYFGNFFFVPVDPQIEKINADTTAFIPLLRKIFFNNYSIAIFIVFIGYFTGGLATVFVVAINGLKSGFEMNYFDISKVGGEMGLIKRIIFHTPLELFALFLMGSIGLRSFYVVKYFIKTKKFIYDVPLISQQMIYQYFTGTFLLFVAAIIEAIIPNFFQNV